LNVAVNKQEYLDRLQAAVLKLFNCGAVWHSTVSVHEIFKGETLWQGDVEVFVLLKHPKAKRAYVWNRWDGEEDERSQFVAVLEIPPVVSAETAVGVQIVKDAKLKKGRKSQN
jgi:hypothetical protein